MLSAATGLRADPALLTLDAVRRLVPVILVGAGRHQGRVRGGAPRSLHREGIHMRLSRLSAVVLLAASGASRLHAQQSSPTQPFGLRFGTSLATLRDQLGARPFTSRFNGWFTLPAVPSPSGPFSSFQLFVSPVSGLCSVTAVSSNIESGPGGAEARQAFSAVRDSLDGVYGTSTPLESVVSNPRYTGPEEWMLSLYYRERTYRVVWNQGSGRFPSQLSEVSLTLQATSEGVAHLVLRVFRVASRECVDEVIAAERASQ